MTFGNTIVIFIYTNGNLVLQIEKKGKVINFLKYA